MTAGIGSRQEATAQSKLAVPTVRNEETAVIPEPIENRIGELTRLTALSTDHS